MDHVADGSGPVSLGAGAADDWLMPMCDCGIPGGEAVLAEAFGSADCDEFDELDGLDGCDAFDELEGLDGGDKFDELGVGGGGGFAAEELPGSVLLVFTGSGMLSDPPVRNFPMVPPSEPLRTGRSTRPC
jgi:hypothetical protein